jgi:nucleotide-binding universal stress UspA family protein
MSVAAAQEPKPVIVGVDGSHASLNAARWAVSEAVNRDVPIRLVHAVRNGYARSTDEALCAAEDEVRETGRSVRVEPAQIMGEPADVLVAESRHAAIVCVGERAANPGSGKLFGSTAVALFDMRAVQWQ